MEKLWVLYIGGKQPQGRLARALDKALRDLPAQEVTELGRLPQGGGRLLFALQLDANGLNQGLYEVLGLLRSGGKRLDGYTAGIAVDGESDFYTKAAAQQLVLSANMAGCAFLGRPLVEGNGDLRAFSVRAGLLKTTVHEAYVQGLSSLAHRLLSFAASPRKAGEPYRVLALHTGNRATSNTLALWGLVKRQLADTQITELNLRNGAVEDCAGCPYDACLHFGEKGSCFYGGVIAEQAYPLVKQADAIVMLCPNYNDALPANMAAFVNRLTALFRTRRFYDKALFAVVVSGYSGGDLVAGQLISGLNMNKSFYLPPRFCLAETANDAGTAVKLPGVEERAGAFGRAIAAQGTICLPASEFSAENAKSSL